jgi:hypothetical protein
MASSSRLQQSTKIQWSTLGWIISKPSSMKRKSLLMPTKPSDNCFIGGRAYSSIMIDTKISLTSNGLNSWPHLKEARIVNSHHLPLIPLKAQSGKLR